jgi:hypothetical protein
MTDRTCSVDREPLAFVRSWSEPYGRGKRQRGVKLWACPRCDRHYHQINGGELERTERTSPTPIVKRRPADPRWRLAFLLALVTACASGLGAGIVLAVIR